ncbi:MAG: hypothetical protein BYD32DRAFT_460666 [Podila humilis]|nr:MAG: hypothetical protein BYD32DRAFT_460666 [Podila humilis]
MPFHRSMFLASSRNITPVPTAARLQSIKRLVNKTISYLQEISLPKTRNTFLSRQQSAEIQQYLQVSSGDNVVENLYWRISPTQISSNSTWAPHPCLSTLWHVRHGALQRQDSTVSLLSSVWILAIPLIHDPSCTTKVVQSTSAPMESIWKYVEDGFTNISQEFLSLSTTLRTLSIPELTTSRLIDLLSLFPNMANLSLGFYTSDFKAHQPAERYGAHPPSPSPVPVPEPLPGDPSIGTNLRVLNIMTVSEWEPLLALLPNLEELTHSQRLTDSLALLLVERCPKLQVMRSDRGAWRPYNRLYDDYTSFDDDDDTSAYGEFANEMLTANNQLRVLDTIAYHLRVDEILRRPWVCMGLEQLSCQIRGLERGRGNDGKAGGGSMAYRQYLDLGFEDRMPEVESDYDLYCKGEEQGYVEYEKPPFDTLELSLASGLGRFGVLKNLEVFGFECMNHRIDRAELEWMAKSWPKLRLVFGLDKERLPKMKHDLKRAELKGYLQELRPDVVHDSLFV